MAIFYFVIFTKFTETTPLQLVVKIFSKTVLPLTTFFILAILSVKYLPEAKSKLNFLIVVLTGGGISFISVIVYYFSCIEFREYLNQVFGKLKVRFVN